MPSERVEILIRARDLASRVFGNVRGALKQVGISARGLAQAFATVVAAGAGLTFVATKIFDLGAAVLETRNKFETVFGKASETVNAFLEDFARLAGVTKREGQDIAATTGAIAQGMGLAGEQSAAFATDVLRLAGDLASFNNLPTADVARAIQAAVTGEREQLKRLGIVIREVDVQQRAMALSGKASAKQLTDQEKATATLQLITEKAGVAIGDLERTSDSAANQMKRLRAQFRDAFDTLSVSLLPALAELLPIFTQIGEAAAEAAPKLAAFAQTLLDTLGVTNATARAEQAAIAKLGDDVDALTRREARLTEELGNKRAELAKLIELAAQRRPGVSTAVRLRAERDIPALREEVLGLAIALDFLQTKLERLQRPVPGPPTPGPRPSPGGGGGFRLPTPQIRGTAGTIQAGIRGATDPVGLALLHGQLRAAALETKDWGGELARLHNQLGALEKQTGAFGLAAVSAFGQIFQAILGGRGAGGILGGIFGGVGSLLGAIPGFGLPAAIFGQVGGLALSAFGGREPSVRVSSFGSEARRVLEREDERPILLTLNIRDIHGRTTAEIRELIRQAEIRDAVARTSPGTMIGVS